jgi:hypothetical protein
VKTLRAVREETLRAEMRPDMSDWSKMPLAPPITSLPHHIITDSLQPNSLHIHSVRTTRCPTKQKKSGDSTEIQQSLARAMLDIAHGNTDFDSRIGFDGEITIKAIPKQAMSMLVINSHDDV